MLELVRGDDNQISIIVKRPRVDPDTGEKVVDVYGAALTDPVDLTGASMTFTARDRKRAAVIVLKSSDGGILFQSPYSEGHASAFVPAETTEHLTAPYYLKYDLELIEQDGTKTTVARGDAVLREDETRG